jgi:Protein of unknwon function (DUF3310)
MKPFQISEDMQTEMVNEIAALVSDTDTHDPTRKMFGAPRLRRRALDRVLSESDAPRSQDDTAGVSEEAVRSEALSEDPINPSHYRRHPSGIECIEVTRHMNFNVGNAVKYIWRYMDKGDPIEQLKKAQWYLDDEIRRLQGQR